MLDLLHDHGGGSAHPWWTRQGRPTTLRRSHPVEKPLSCSGCLKGAGFGKRSASVQRKGSSQKPEGKGICKVTHATLPGCEWRLYAFAIFQDRIRFRALCQPESQLSQESFPDLTQYVEVKDIGNLFFRLLPQVRSLRQSSACNICRGPRAQGF